MQLGKSLAVGECVIEFMHNISDFVAKTFLQVVAFKLIVLATVHGSYLVTYYITCSYYIRLIVLIHAH
jgi:hypothetical protein